MQQNLSRETFIIFDGEVVTSASYMSYTNFLIEFLPNSIEDQDDDVIEDLDFSPLLMRPSKSDVEKALDKLQDLSLLSSYGN